MKRNLIITIVGTVFLVFGIAQAGISSGTDDVKPSLIYGEFIDNYVNKCECKASLLDAGSLNIRKTAVQATVKGAYLKSNRTKLIRASDGDQRTVKPQSHRVSPQSAVCPVGEP